MKSAAPTVETHYIALNPAQYAAAHSTAAETFFIGGIGAGKTYFLALRLWYAMQRGNGITCGLFAPTQKTLNNSTLSALKSIWAGLGLEEGPKGYYIINKRAPESWGVVSPYESHNKIMTTRDGAFCILDGLDNFDTHRGTELDEVFFDEFRDMRQEEIRNLFLGRLRGKCYKRLGLKHRAWYATTPPEDPTYLLQIKESVKDAAFYFAVSKDNARNLPDGYVDRLSSAYDEKVYQREVMGMLIHINEGRFAYKFDDLKHISTGAVYNPKLEIYISFDFNITPMTATIWQTDRHTWAYCIDEIKIDNATIYDTLAEIKIRYPNQYIYITGDASGRARNTLSNRTIYEVIVDELQISRSANEVPLSNPSLRESRIFLNSLLAHNDGIKFNPACVATIHDLRYSKVNAEGGIDKRDPKLSHLLDTVRYFLHTFFSKNYELKFVR